MESCLTKPKPYKTIDNSIFCSNCSKENYKNYSSMPKLKRRIKSKIYKELREDMIIQNINESWLNYVEPAQNVSNNNTEGCLFMMNFSKDGSVLSTSSVNNIDFWDTKTRKNICTLTEHKEIVTNLEWFKDPYTNKFASCSLDKSIKIWDDYKCQLTLTHHEDWLRCMSISKDNQYLLSGCVSAMVMGYDLNKMNIAFKIKHRVENNMLNTINTVNFRNSDNIFLTGTRDGFVRIFDIRDLKKPAYEIFAHNNKLNSAFFADNDTTILTAGRDSLSRLWDLRYLPKNTESKSKVVSGHLIEYKGHKSQGYNIASYFFGSEKYIITGSEDSNIYIYKTSDASLVRKIPTKSKIIHILRPLPDPQYGFAFSGLQENFIHFFDATTSVDEVESAKYQKLMDNKIDFEETTLKLVEEFMSEYGDLILKVFHKNNFTYSSGMTWENLLRIVTQEDDEDSKELLKKFNEELIKKMQNHFTRDHSQPTSSSKPCETKEKDKKDLGLFDGMISNDPDLKFCETCEKKKEMSYLHRLYKRVNMRKL